jgi:hypothetical protein
MRLPVLAFLLAAAGFIHEQNPQMRPGEDCMRCHGGGEEDDAPAWTAAGTVYADPEAAAGDGIQGAVVRLTDANGRKISLETNGAGNFYTRESLKFPVSVEVVQTEKHNRELLRNLSPEQLSRIGSIAREVKYPPGKLILEAGQPLDALYVIVDGAADIARNGEVIHTARQNDVLGAWALFDQDPMPVDARTVEDTRVLRIGRDDFYDLGDA